MLDAGCLNFLSGIKYQASSIIMNTQINCALIGPGNFGRGLAHALQEDERVHFMGVLGANAQESAEGAEALGGKGYDSLDTLLADDALQAVFVATPSDTHAELVADATAAGKHVFVEKPMALTVAECDAMIDAAERTGVKLMVGQVQRYFPLLAAARDLVLTERIGRPATALMYRHDMLRRTSGSWLQRRANVGGLLHQSCVHELDWLRFALGDVSEVFARATPVTIQTGLNFPDAVEISLGFSSGCAATLSACMTSYVEQHGAIIHGTKGGLRLDLLAGTLDWRDDAGNGESLHHDDFVRGAGHRAATRQELRAFVDGVLDDAPIPIPGEEGRATIEIIQAALISLADRRPVALPLADDQRERRAYLELK